MPNTVEIMVRSESGSIGENLGTNFLISSDVGAVVPNTATKNELISGKILTVGELASTIILTSSGGTCTNTLSINIDKEASTCYSANASSFQLGNTRPLDEDGAAAPFSTGSIDLQKIQEIKSKTVSDTFVLNIFNKNINFLIDSDSIDPDSQSVIKSGTANSSAETFTFLFDENTNLDLNFIILSQDTNASYKITGSPTIGYQVEEWSIYDMISF
jgi:hypothetical protein